MPELSENLSRFPALTIDLSQEQIDRTTPGMSILGLTSHQKSACRLVAQELNWHPSYVAELCPKKRPPLLRGSGAAHWEAHCQDWKEEHELSISELAEKYKIEFLSIADRIFEPLATHADGVKMSAHDMGMHSAYPCPVAEW